MSGANTYSHLREVLGEIDTELCVVTTADFPAVFSSQIEERHVVSVALGSDSLLGDLNITEMLLQKDVGIIGPLHGKEMREEIRDWHHALAGADVGITSGIGIAEETGSVLLPPHTPDERAMSLLPPAHWVILKASQLVPDVGTLLAKWLESGAGVGSAVMVSGPSRTADIEKELVLGVHGPQTVTVFLIVES